MLASFFYATILNHQYLGQALGFHLANKMDSTTVSAMTVREVFEEAMAADLTILDAVARDIEAAYDRDPACELYSIPFLYFKGFHALQAQRVAHWLWQQGRRSMALFFQSQISRQFGVDVHPAAQLGAGLMIDHATGVVIGETCVIEDNVSMLHSVTLGGTGHQVGDRHPKIRRGVLISAGAKILGNVEIGEGAVVGAGSLVLEDVAPHTTVAGVPARVVGRPSVDQPALDMNHRFAEEE
jgi:serine O-acetyltransferase